MTAAARAQGMTRRDVGLTLKTHQLALGSDYHHTAGFHDAPNSRTESRQASSGRPSRRPSFDDR